MSISESLISYLSVVVAIVASVFALWFNIKTNKLVNELSFRVVKYKEIINRESIFDVEKLSTLYFPNEVYIRDLSSTIQSIDVTQDDGFFDVKNTDEESIVVNIKSEVPEIDPNDFIRTYNS